MSYINNLCLNVGNYGGCNSCCSPSYNNYGGCNKCFNDYCSPCNNCNKCNSYGGYNKGCGPLDKVLRFLLQLLRSGGQY